MRDVKASFVEGDKSLVFVRQPVDGSTAKLMRISLKGGKAEPLITDSETSNVDLFVAPNGRQIAFRAVDYDAERAVLESEIKFAELNQGSASIASTTLESEVNEWVTWTPDSKGITRIGSGETQEFVNVGFPGSSRETVVKTPYEDVIRFYWYENSKRMLLVRGYVSHDLVLINDGSEAL